MKFDSAIELQEEANHLIEVAFTTKQSLNPKEDNLLFSPFLATGIHINGKNDYQLALHLETEDLLEMIQPLKTLKEKAHGEVNIQITGSVHKQSLLQQHHRPLRIGASVSHYLGDVGTLGCFVRKRRSIKQKIIDFFRPSNQSELLILSNNHVLANENDAQIGDAIIQPGCQDGGDIQNHTIGHLQEFIALQKNASNLVDAALAKVDNSFVQDLSLLDDNLSIKGIYPEKRIEENIFVVKVGRTTFRTEGKIRDIMLRGKSGNGFGPVNYGTQRNPRNYYFDTVIAIEGRKGETFSKPGDSGSIIVDERGYAVALLFAGSTNGIITYGIPINKVLKELDVELVCG